MELNYHFTMRELCKSVTAQQLGIDNEPKAYEYLALYRPGKGSIRTNKITCE